MIALGLVLLLLLVNALHLHDCRLGLVRVELEKGARRGGSKDVDLPVGVRCERELVKNACHA